MRTTFVALLLVFLYLLPGFTHAQTRHSISLSYSPISLKGLQNSGKDDGKHATIVPGEYGYKAVGNDRSYPGVLMLSYSYRFSQKVKTGMDIGFEEVTRKWDVYEQPSGMQTVNQQIHSLYVLPSVGYLYPCKNPALSVSSIVQAGISYRWSDFRYSLPKDKSHYSFAAQVWIASVQYRFGVFALNCELGAGSMGFCRAGLGCVF